MKKVFYFNFDVGSGVEYTGNVILDWLKEIEGVEIYNQKLQDQPAHLITEMIREKPDIVVMNEIFHKSTDTTYYYKKFFPNVKVLTIAHSYDALLINPDCNVEGWKTVKFYQETLDNVITLNHVPNNVVYPPYLENRVISGLFPADPTIFKSKIPWIERKKLFCYLGYTMPIKVSIEFLKMVKEYTDLKIDFYTELYREANEEYTTAFKESGVNIFSLVPQNEVVELLNQYKYFVLPHGRYSEIFNVTLLQSILCGTIPLVCNDRTDNSFNFKWIDWARTLYFGCDKEKDFLNNLDKIQKENPDFSNVSIDIIERAKKKFDYNGLKACVQRIIRNYISEGRNEI